MHPNLLSGIKVLKILKNWKKCWTMFNWAFNSFENGSGLENRSWGHILYWVLAARIKKQFTFCPCPWGRRIVCWRTTHILPCHKSMFSREEAVIDWQYKHQVNTRVGNLCTIACISLPFYSEMGVGLDPLSRLRMSVPKWVVVGIK